MEVNVNVKNTISTIQKERKEYIATHNKNVKLYHKKLKEYADYVLGLTKTKHTGSIKSPPSVPTDQSDEFDNSIDLLRAHSGTHLKMKDDEFYDLMSVLKKQKIWNDSTTMSLNAVSY